MVCLQYFLCILYIFVGGNLGDLMLMFCSSLLPLQYMKTFITETTMSLENCTLFFLARLIDHAETCKYTNGRGWHSVLFDVRIIWILEKNKNKINKWHIAYRVHVSILVSACGAH